MRITKTRIEGLLIIEPRVFSDDRGYFFESFRLNLLEEAYGKDIDFKQDNQSFSSKNTLRGLHFQNPPFEQGKLVTVIKGKALDVAVDLRKSSSTYGEHFKIELNDENHKSFWIPPGFAHGFLALEENTIFSYKCTNYYNQSAEESIIWNDPDLKIDWGIDSPLISEKDDQAQRFNTFASQF